MVERISKNQEEYWKEGLALKQELIHLQRTSFSLDLIFHWEAVKKHPFCRLRISNLVNLLCGNVPTVLRTTMIETGNNYICKFCRKIARDVGFLYIMECRESILKKTTMGLFN